MKLSIALLAVFVHSLNAQCKFSNPTFNANLVSFYKSSSELTIEQYKKELKDLRGQLTDFKNSIDVECMQLVVVRDMFDGLSFMLQMLDEFDEETKNVFFDNANIECFRKIKQDQKSCMGAKSRIWGIDFCNDINISKYMNCTLKYVDKKCNITDNDKEEVYKMYSWILNYGKDHHHCEANLFMKEP